MSDITAGFAVCGSFCTFSKVFPQIKELAGKGIDIIPIMSHIAASTDTRFGEAGKFTGEFRDITKREIITTVDQAEPIGPKKLLDILIIAPCTGNTLAKLAAGIADTSVTMAAKSHLRNGRPVLIAVSTNDALAGAAKNIGALMNYKNIYFVPMRQDDCLGKPTSLVADFSRIYDSMLAALQGRQIQPLFLPCVSC